ncbi:MAG TPA: thioredoxin domain-containing protein [Candidatus Acidoferrum sp.]
MLIFRLLAVRCFAFTLVLCVLAAPLVYAQDSAPSEKSAKPAAKNPPQQPAQTEQQELQKAIDEAGNDRAALVRNLEAFLKTYPESQQRSQIYRAIVESSLKVDDYARATDYAERMVALRPDDASINVLAIQLLERNGDAAGWRRATSYCTRVLEMIGRTSVTDKSPRVSPESWESDRKRDRASVLLVRGRLYQKLNDLPNAQKDYEASYALQPSALAAAKLGEIAELRKDPNTAIQEYARAFALAGDSSGAASRAELRKKIGNVWRLAHGSEDGLGDYLLHSFDEVSTSIAPAKTVRNAGIKNPYEFVLRRAPSGAPFPMADTKGRVLVLNFWATWCGPCRELEPHFEKIAAHYAGDKDIQFFQLNCDDDETLVGPYLEEEKPKTTILFADNLESYFAVSSFPTTVILGRDGKIAFRSDGFDPDTVDKTLSDAIERVLHGAGAEATAVK